MSHSRFGRHQSILARLLRRIGNQIDAIQRNSTMLSNVDWIVNKFTVVRPDLVVPCGGIPECHVESTPSLVIEIISPNTRNNDLNYKRSLCGTEGIGIYVIVNLQQQHPEIDELDSDGQYGSREKVESIDVSSCDDCPIKLDFTELSERIR